MKNRIPTITAFASAFKVCNRKGFSILKENRENSVIIIVLRGKIRFTQNDNSVIALPDAPIYISGGVSYLNECLEDAESLLFNFEEATPSGAMASLHHIEHQKAIRIFGHILERKERGGLRADAEILSALYLLVSECYPDAVTAERGLIAPALKYVDLHYADNDLTAKKLAALCCISTVYLNKLFRKEVGEPPFSYITRRRMEIACEMLRERYAVGEIARLVGYSEIYQFSRAFKKYYGMSPKRFVMSL
jgi:AraC-like DNA-binding protein